MTGVHDLPTELLFKIFETIDEFSPNIPTDYYERLRSTDLFYQDPDSDYDDSIGRQDTRHLDSLFVRRYQNPGLFPFNLSLVCTRWRDILAYSPKYWTVVVFDVAHGQSTHHLDMLSSPENEEIMVYVFSSATDMTEEERDRENARVALITECLYPHIARCTSIVFQVAFASSLPHPNLLFRANCIKLEELRLDWRIYDVVPPLAASKQPNTYPTFLDLKHLSLSGNAFMDLATMGKDWLGNAKFADDLTLEVSHLQLREERDEHTRNFNTMMSILDVMKTSYSISFKDISLDYPPRKRRKVDRTFSLETCNIYFENVSAGFLTEFYNSTSVLAEYTTFTHCTIPRTRGPLSGELDLIDIPVDDAPAPSDQSLRNALSIWTGSELRLRSCPSFTDDTLGWMGTRNRPTDLESMHIYDCPNFTPIGIRHLLSIQSAYSTSQFLPLTSFLRDVHAIGKVPALEEDDVEWIVRWLRESANQRNCVQWRVSQEERERINSLYPTNLATFDFPI